MGLFGTIGKGLSKIGGLASKAAPLVGLIPGFGTVAGGVLGAGGALLSGENIGTALKRGALGAGGAFGLSKIGGLAGIGKLLQAGPEQAAAISSVGKALGGGSTEANARILAGLGVKAAGALEGHAAQGNVVERSNALEQFFAQQSQEGNARLDALQQRLATSGTGRFN